MLMKVASWWEPTKNYIGSRSSEATESASTENESTGGWNMHASTENASTNEQAPGVENTSTENASTNLQRWKK